MTLSRRTLLAAGLGAPLAGPARRWRVVAGAAQAEDADAALPVPAPRVARFERLAFGLFVHWGLYSRLGAGEWAMHHQGLGAAEYMRLMEGFDAAEFDGRALARTAKRAGQGYVTLTTRHHDGFSLYDTRGLSPWDVTHTPAGRDLVRDFVEGCRAEGVLPMLYHTTLDWSDPRFERDFPAYLAYLRASIELLCTRYGPLGGFWLDGCWSKPDADWELDLLYGLIRARQPEALIIDNTGIGAGGEIGHPEIDSVTFERGRPAPLDRRGHAKHVAGEMCHTLNFHWGRAERDFNWLSPAHVIEELCGCRRAGANLLLNVGPTAGGAVGAYEAAVLSKVGDWLALHGGAASTLYAGRPAGIVGADRDFGLRAPGGATELFVFDLTPTADTRAHGAAARGPGPRVFEGVAGPVTAARWLDSGEELTFEHDPASGRLVLHATGYPYGTNTVVRVARLTA